MKTSLGLLFGPGMVLYLAGALLGYTVLGLEIVAFGTPSEGFFPDAGYVQVYLMVYTAPFAVGLLASLTSVVIRPWLLLGGLLPAALVTLFLVSGLAINPMHLVPVLMLAIGAASSHEPDLSEEGNTL